MNEEFKNDVKFLAENVVNKEASVVFYGSSSIRLWDSLSSDFKELNLINLAFGGSTIEDCVGYYPQLLGSTQPEVVVFYAGDNDIGNGADASMVLARFIQLSEMIQTDFPTTPIVFISIKPSPIRKEYLTSIKAANLLIETYIDLQPNIFFLDVFSQMMLSTDEIDTSLFLEDQLHMNEKGYKIWRNILTVFFDQKVSKA